MTDSGMEARDLLEALLEVAQRAELEVRILGRAAGGQDFAPTTSSACRVGDRVWVVLAPDDPPANQADVLAGTLARYRAEFLEETFVPPAVRAHIEAREPSEPN